MSFIPSLNQINAGNADDPSRDMGNWNSIVAIVNGQLGDVNFGTADPLSGTKIATETIPYTAVNPFDKASVTRGSTQLISTASGTAVSFTSAAYQRLAGDMWVIGNPTKVVIKTTGKYSLSGFASFASNSTGYRQFSIKVNGSVIRYVTVPAVNGDETGLTISAQVSLAVSDYVELFAYQNSGGNLNVIAGAYLDVSLLP